MKISLSRERVKEQSKATAWAAGGLLSQWWLRSSIPETCTCIPEPPTVWVLACVPLLSPSFSDNDRTVPKEDVYPCLYPNINSNPPGDNYSKWWDFKNRDE